jgi:hypothetical protein
MTDDDVDEARLRDLMDEVSALPRSIEPPADAWTNIRAAIESDHATRTHSDQRHISRTTFWQRPVFLAAAAVVLVLGSSGVTAVAIRRGAVATLLDRANGNTRHLMRDDPGSSAGPASLAQFTVVESDYLQAVNDLSATLESEPGSLSPETIAKLRESLKVIDAAILEARNALAADPANRTLIQMLSTSYDQKVDLLRRTAEMARS